MDNLSQSVVGLKSVVQLPFISLVFEVYEYGYYSVYLGAAINF
jgi:hypothetical protein